MVVSQLLGGCELKAFLGVNAYMLSISTRPSPSPALNRMDLLLSCCMVPAPAMTTALR